MAISNASYRPPAPSMGDSWRSAAQINSNRNNPHQLACSGARASQRAITALTSGGLAGKPRNG